MGAHLWEGAAGRRDGGARSPHEAHNGTWGPEVGAVVTGEAGVTVFFCMSGWQFIKYRSSWASVHLDSEARDETGGGMNLDIRLLGIMVKESPRVQ